MIIFDLRLGRYSMLVILGMVRRTGHLLHEKRRKAQRGSHGYLRTHPFVSR